MRPIRLSMSAFGPFAKKEIIEFERMGENPLFLINGPTGAGKSTILDAICFALYGETTGNERDARQMRCDHAEADLLTEITLEFELLSGRYRITRIPDQLRPKARGEGYTEQKARAELYRITADEAKLLVAPKITEATEAIINLTGLSAEQFRQVMVLPQGKFRELLLARSEERESIFQQLFQTHVYSRLQSQLREKTNELSAKLKELSQQQAGMLVTHELDSVEQLEENLSLLQVSLQELVKQKQNAENELAKQQALLNESQQLAKLFDELKIATEKLAINQQVQAEIDSQKQSLEKSGKAREIDADYLEVEKCRTLAEKSAIEVERQRKQVAISEKELDALEADYRLIPDKEKQLDKAKIKFNELEALEKKIGRLVVVSESFKNANKDAEFEDKQVAIISDQLKLLKEQLIQNEAEYLEGSKAVSLLPAKRSELEKLKERGTTLRNIADFQRGIIELGAELKEKESSQNKQKQQYETLNREKEIYQQAWQTGQAAILAAMLLPDEPCVVCGSRDHPQPAVSEKSLPSEQELNRKTEAADKSRSALEKMAREKMRIESEIARFNEKLEAEQLKLNIDTPSENYDLLLEEMRKDFQRCRDEIAQLENIDEALAKLLQTIDETKNKIIQRESELESTRKQAWEKHSLVTAAKTEMESLQQILPENCRDMLQLNEQLAELQQQINLLKTTIETTSSNYQRAKENKIAAMSTFKVVEEKLQDDQKKFGEVVVHWRQVIRNSEFSNEQEFLNARIDTVTEKQYVDSIRKHEDEKLVLQKTLEEKTQRIQNRSLPDLEAINENHQKIAKEKKQLDEAYHQTDQKIKNLQSLKEKLKTLQEERSKLELEYGVVGKLSDVSNGKNPHNLSLQRFVLSVLLDDVLTEASFRLSKMSKGRFALYRKESVDDKRSKAGLELVVEDAYSGKQRPAATLSGGESFMAALALALGLSDVVQAYAGGIRLDTLFIDEGFGSLDPESLDQAINTLIDLKNSGRMVGIISHVEELKRIIDVRLDVIANREISSTALVGI